MRGLHFISHMCLLLRKQTRHAAERLHSVGMEQKHNMNEVEKARKDTNLRNSQRQKESL